ncbi:MAG: glycoside hydrolase family 3 protein, partial [Oscillospiraceae bacterium]|nr:glycoside hydrolase family 3 protein [Oscillospiraceae bacterium]
KEGTKEEVISTFEMLMPGGCMFRPLSVEKSVELVNIIQEKSKYPMLIAANLEKGGNGIVESGTLVGTPMQIAATRDTEMVIKMARVCAREASAVGANWSFAPIIDIDSNFRNPITNTRTFGSNPDLVADMGEAYVKEIQSHGLAASIKHFPGDGQDERDQHLLSSINDMSPEDWDKTYGMIYKRCIDAGTLTCMVGHILQPAYSKKLNPELKDEDILPGSLSKELLNGLLRNKLGFNGLIITDATVMAGFTTAMSREKAVPYSIAAGCDMFLFTINLKEDYEFMLKGVYDGIISPERLDEAVRRILALKAALNLDKPLKKLSFAEADEIVGCSEHLNWANECADRSVTLVKEQNGVLPITTDKYKNILYYPIEATDCIGAYGVREGACNIIKNKLQDLGFNVTEFAPVTESEGEPPCVKDIINKYDLILYVANLATKSNQTTVRIEWQQPIGSNCPHYINDIPTVFVSIENPYHLLDVPRIKTFINTYCSSDSTIDALIDKLIGKSPFKGKSPVDPFCGKWDTRL